MADPRRTDPNRYDANRSDPSRGIPDGANRQARDYVKSRTPAERRAEKAAGHVARLQATTQGVAGINVVKNTHQLDELAVQKPAGVPRPISIQCTGNLNGVPAMCFVAAYSVPKPI